MSDYPPLAPEDLLQLKREASVTFSDEIRHTKAYEGFVADHDAKKAWVDGLATCDLCYGKGWRLAPVLREPAVIHYTDGKPYTRGSVVVNGVVYRGFVEADMEPKTKKVFCDHGKNP